MHTLWGKGKQETLRNDIKEVGNQKVDNMKIDLNGFSTEHHGRRETFGRLFSSLCHEVRHVWTVRYYSAASNIYFFTELLCEIFHP